MKKKLEEALKDFYRINDELNGVKKRLEKIVSDTLEDPELYFKVSCQVMPDLVNFLGDEQSYLGIKVSIEYSSIDLETILSMKEAVGAKKVSVNSVVDTEHLGDTCNSRLEFEFVFPYVSPF
jgi:hypothetical protein